MEVKYVFLIILLLFTNVNGNSTRCHNKTNSSRYINLSFTSIASTDIKREGHPLSRNWLLLSLLGILGTILNSFVLRVFYKNRNALQTSINTMTW